MATAYIGDPSGSDLRAHDPEKRSKPTPSQVPETAPGQPSLKTHRILVVEDNLINQMVAKKMLQALGCEVDIAENGADGVRMIERGDYDLVFMDCQMPVMDGYEATQAIRAGGSSRDIPIIALTANVLPEEKRRCFEVGMDEFLAKPIDRPRLNKLVRSYLNSPRVRRNQ